MKIELHASNNMTIETSVPNISYDVNESDGKLDIKSTSKKDIEISYLDYTTLDRVTIYTGHYISIKEVLATK